MRVLVSPFLADASRKITGMLHLPSRGSFNVDARGAVDEAAVRAIVRRELRETMERAAPHIAAATIKAH